MTDNQTTLFDSVQQAVEYRDIPGFPGYRVGDDGSVWSCWRRSSLGRGRGTVVVIGDEWKRLRLSNVGKYGHKCVWIGRGNYRRVGPLILEVFVGPCPPRMECRHLDGDPKNNFLGNLCWGSSRENTDDQRRHGTLVGGERHGMAKLTNEQIQEILSLAGTMPQRAIGKLFGVTQGHINHIINRKNRTESSHSGRGLSNG